MLRHLSLLACLAVTTACFAGGPADHPSAGTVSNASGDAGFLAAVSTLNAYYFNSTGTPTAGGGFVEPTGFSAGTGMAMRLWFVSQDAGWTNGFGVNTGSGDQLAFANSHTASFGDYVDVNGGAATQITDFFALAHITGPHSAITWHDGTAINGDRHAHIDMSLLSPFTNAGSTWYAIALDDQWGGGDRDWNDLRLILQVRPVSAPEPTTVVLFGGFLAIGAWLWRRQQKLALG